MHWIVGDIHGYYDEFIEMLCRIDKVDKEAHIILVGDIIDRGPKTWEMIQWAMENIDNTSVDSRFRMVIGNHGYEKIYWAEKNNYAYKHRDRYGFHEVMLKNTDIKGFREIINWFNSLPYYINLYIEGRHFVVALAYLPDSVRQFINNPNIVLTEHEKEVIVWERCKPTESTDVTIVCGHTPTILYHEVGWYTANPGKIDKSEKFINVDCGLVYSSFNNHNLAALCLETMEELYLYNN